MIVTNSKPYGVIRGSLRKWKKIGLIACNSCARVCETGGQKKLEELEERLKKDGFTVVGADVVPLTCNITAVKRRSYDGDYLVVLACDSGVFTVQSLFPNKVVVPALNTIGLGAKDSQGNIFLMKKF
ncbi:MAG: hypothetical protein NWF10_02520 [Candidatus Bathyarchaeota archaeon]|jgi:arginine repressor|nr:hypothetical protein [Candidatus Bathyarchaeota archaeon]